MCSFCRFSLQIRKDLSGFVPVFSLSAPDPRETKKTLAGSSSCPKASESPPLSDSHRPGSRRGSQKGRVLSLFPWLSLAKNSPGSFGEDPAPFVCGRERSSRSPKIFPFPIRRHPTPDGSCLIRAGLPCQQRIVNLDLLPAVPVFHRKPPHAQRSSRRTTRPVKKMGLVLPSRRNDLRLTAFLSDLGPQQALPKGAFHPGTIELKPLAGEIYSPVTISGLIPMRYRFPAPIRSSLDR